MRTPIITLQDVLINTLDIEIAIGDVEQFIEIINEKSKYLPVLRTLKSYRENKVLDFCGHLRQCMSYFICGFDISEELYRMMFEHKNLFGFIFQSHNGYKVNIDTVIMPNIPDLKSTYEFKKRRLNKPSVADGRLYRYYRYTTYTSLSQKMLMYFIANMESNETLLACLPTGGGKSLSWQLPAISNSYNGLIIVVVPTIALAIDHERTSKTVYDNVFGSDSYPLAYHSGIDLRKKKSIYDGVDAGTLPILYISPEALQNKEFQNKIYTAAQKGKISALIVDEAHLIVNWGVRFRPEFQLLSSFRNNLKANCPNGLKTILLSATYTVEDTEIIKTIFADDIFTEYRADELRQEPSYYYHKCNSEYERIDLVKKLVCQTPRPIIVYTVGPEEGVKYFDAIKDMGYKNVDLFTGQTGNNDRQSIIEDWNKNKIDIIVATSAFGMGVDKADIRTIITAYIPENISRFYQEVGRSGRDGYSSLNYFLTYEEIDKEYVKSLTKGTVLTVSSLVNRWKELLAESARATPDTVWIDVNVPPEHLRFSQTGKRNAGWNKDVLLLLFRAGLIEIIDVSNIRSDDYKIHVRLKNIKVLEHTDLLKDYITRYREGERERINEGIASIKKLLKAESTGCYSKFLVDEFPYAERICNGCPYCRNAGLEHFYNGGHIIAESDKVKLSTEFQTNSNDIFITFLSVSNSIMLSITDTCKEDKLCNCIEFLVKKGVNVIIAPMAYDTEKLLFTLSYYDSYKYLILTLEEAFQIDIKWLSGVCALVYSDNNSDNQRLYDFAIRYEEAYAGNKVIHIAKADQYIKSQMRPLSEIVDQNLSGEQILL